MISDKLIFPSQLKCLEMNWQCMNIVQGDANTVFRHLATLVHSKPSWESFGPSGRIPGIQGLRKKIKEGRLSSMSGDDECPTTGNERVIGIWKGQQHLGIN